MIKAVFFDIDGTLVSFNTHRMPGSAVKSIRLLREKGIKVFIATGRHLAFINNLGDSEFDGYITLNGGYCYAGKEKTIYKHGIPKEDMESLLRYFKNTEEFPCVFVQERDAFMNFRNEVTEEVFKLLNFPVPPLASNEGALEKEVYQLVAFFEKEQKEQIMAVLPHCEATSWHPAFSDIVPAGSDKSVGMDKVIEYFGIALEETMAFGDGGNDIPMLRHAHIGIAMGNAREEVKQAADYVTASVDEDGISKALKHFGLI